MGKHRPSIDAPTPHVPNREEPQQKDPKRLKLGKHRPRIDAPTQHVPNLEEPKGMSDELNCPICLNESQILGQ